MIGSERICFHKPLSREDRVLRGSFDSEPAFDFDFDRFFDDTCHHLKDWILLQADPYKITHTNVTDRLLPF